MPEGPEIRRAADKLQEAIVGQPLRAVEFAFARLKHFEDELCASTITEVETRGKAMLTHFANGLSVYSHNQLYGRWYVIKAGRTANTRRSLRFAVRGESREVLLYSASDIEVLDDIGIATHPFLQKLGPDVLSTTLSEARTQQQLRDRRFQRRRLADVLLDQAFFAGIGNYLRSEILFQARLLPTRKLGELRNDEQNDLARAILLICRRAYQHGGVTNDLQRAAELKAAGLSFGQRRHAVFQRGAQACYLCQSIIEHAELNRRVFWCPSCQR